MNASRYKDLDIKLRQDLSGNIREVSGLDAIYQSIKTILGTYPGERLMMPQFGSKLRNLLFEPMNEFTADRMSLEIEQAISIWEDRVVVREVDVAPNVDRNIYDITISFTVTNTNVNDQLKLQVKVLA